jgi:ribosome-associated translation inhibitor RaiA
LNGITVSLQGDPTIGSEVGIELNTCFNLEIKSPLANIALQAIDTGAALDTAFDTALDRALERQGRSKFISK